MKRVQKGAKNGAKHCKTEVSGEEFGIFRTAHRRPTPSEESLRLRPKAPARPGRVRGLERDLRV